MTSSFTAREVLQTSGLQMVDIRPLTERFSGLGFPPGSLSVPLEPDSGRHHASVLAAVQDYTPVLLCLSGHRARACAHEHGFAYLEGGTLAWSAEGLPTTGYELGPANDAVHLDEFPRHMASCFVGQVVETGLDQEARGATTSFELTDPMELLAWCFRWAGTSFDHPSAAGVLQALDRAAALSLRLGTPMDTVARNVDYLLQRLPPPTRALVA